MGENSSVSASCGGLRERVQYCRDLPKHADAVAQHLASPSGVVQAAKSIADSDLLAVTGTEEIRRCNALALNNGAGRKAVRAASSWAAESSRHLGAAGGRIQAVLAEVYAHRASCKEGVAVDMLLRKACESAVQRATPTESSMNIAKATVRFARDSEDSYGRMNCEAQSSSEGSVYARLVVPQIIAGDTPQSAYTPMEEDAKSPCIGDRDENEDRDTFPVCPDDWMPGDGVPVELGDAGAGCSKRAREEGEVESSKTSKLVREEP